MKKIYLLTILLTLFALTACEDFLEEKPRGLLAPENFYQSLNDADAAVIGLYDLLSRVGFCDRNWYLPTDVSSDDFYVAGTAGTRVDFSFFTVTANAPELNGLWNSHFSMINRANEAIGGIPNVSGDPVRRDDLLGEAMFFRALAYFDLVRLFGDVPLMEEPLSDPNDLSRPRTEESEIYNLIIEDLTFASENMLVRSERNLQASRIAKGAAQTLLAQAYITRATKSFSHPDDYLRALELTEAVIQSGEYGLFPEWGQAFDKDFKNGIESIFALQSVAAAAPHNRVTLTVEMMPQINGTTSGPWGTAWANYTATEDLYMSYEDGDIRKEGYMVKDSMQLDDGTWATINERPGAYPKIYALKYKEPVGMIGANSNVNYPRLRYPDVLLIHAEASNEVNGPTAAGYNSINEVRIRAGLTELTNGLSQEEFREAVWLERRHEFAYEGKRFFDLKRTGRLKERVEAAKSGVTVELPKHLLFPIPQLEVDANSEINSNNPGY